MATPLPHPRRRFLKQDMPAAHPHPLSTHHIDEDPTGSKTDRALKKSSTFHSPTTPPSEDEDPIVNILRLPRRTSTDPKALEDVVSAREHRIASLLGSVDRSLSGLEGFAGEDREASHAEDLPVPRFMLDDNASDPDSMDIDTPTAANTPPARRKHHASDSGIGSTITESEEIRPKDLTGTHHPIADTSGTPSAVNGSTPNPASVAQSTQHALSEYACRQIQKHIISPIVSEASLKAFHPLVAGIPYRVSRKEITCLRDLEKVLLWLAPKWSSSKRSFLHFCETSIQCIHTTVEYLNESDQRRPTDRPYTNGYFLDLTEQIRQYAAMISAARERRVAGTSTAEDEAMAHEKVRLRGGYSQNGRAAELVRVRDGQAVSLRTGEVVKSSDSPVFGRASSEECSDDDVLRSMARRKKNAPVEKTMQQCSECDKTFKRPCDLTKHEKTHSRPWKCSESSCKYHTYGWPTEKERDRHVNDKHSVTPSMFKCQYHPCPYESKRESNCKQHMEKAHGWAYIRSKNNGKTKTSPNNKTIHTPQLSTSQLPTPKSYFSPSPVFARSGIPFDPLTTHEAAASMAGSSSTTSEVLGQAANFQHPFFGNDDYTAVNADIAWNESYPSAGPSTSAEHHFSWEAAPMITPPTAAPVIETSAPTEQLPLPLFGDNFDWSNMNVDNDYTTSYNVQLVTPASSVQNQPMGMFDPNPTVCVDEPKSFSPVGQGNVTLLSPSYSSHDGLCDEGYEEFATEAGKPTHDFSLYGNDASLVDGNGSGSQQLFQDLSPFVPPTWPTSGSELGRQLVEASMMGNMEH